MTQAPATIVATAVRQHGGGRHPLNLPCSVPAGRLQDSRGGVINRRAEGATSSHPLPASCAAAAHPTTGVRRARELSPSLRSQNRPHAQLVEGYASGLEPHVRKFSSLLGVIEMHTMSMLISAAEGFHVRSQITILVIRNKPSTPFTELHGYLCRVSKCIKYFIHGSDRGTLREQHAQNFAGLFKASQIDTSTESAQTVYLTIKAIHCYIAFVYSLRSQFTHAKGLNVLSSLSLPSFLFVRVMRYSYRDAYRTNRTNGLYPPRSVWGQPALLHPVGNRPHQQPKSATTNQKPPESPQAPFLHLFGNLKPRHPQQLHAEINRRSLPAPCHHVQRGAA